MKSIFKRSAIGLVVLGMSATSFAYHQGNANQGAMWMPQVNGAFIGAEGLYLRPQNGDLDYVTVIPVVAGDPFVTHNFSTKYDWGWRVYAGINITDQDDITVSWAQLDESYSTFLEGNPSVITRFEQGGLVTTEHPQASINFKLNEGYAVWGHTVHFNNPWSLRFAGGVEYARLNSDLRIALLTTANDHADFTAPNTFKGWGPRFELDATYGLPCGLNWFLRTDLALLSANRSIALNANPPIEGSDNTTVSGTWDTKHVIIPKVGMKIGIGYDYFFGQAGAEGACGTTITAEIGWQADVYIHAIERPENGIYTTDPFVPSPFDNRKVSNFSEQGMFIGLKVGTDWI